MKTWMTLCAGLVLAAPALAAADGPALYEQHCARCHGATGNADTWRGYLYFAPAFSDADWQRRHGDERILRAINRGPGAMPAFEKTLTADERQALVGVVRGFAPK